MLPVEGREVDVSESGVQLYAREEATSQLLVVSVVRVQVRSGVLEGKEMRKSLHRSSDQCNACGWQVRDHRSGIQQVVVC